MLSLATSLILPLTLRDILFYIYDHYKLRSFFPYFSPLSANRVINRWTTRMKKCSGHASLSCDDPQRTEMPVDKASDFIITPEPKEPFYSNKMHHFLCIFFSFFFHIYYVNLYIYIYISKYLYLYLIYIYQLRY